jgi:cell fate regulator YaaT (PSP1 superfamily)
VTQQGRNNVQTVVGVRFKKAGKVYYFDPGQVKITAGDFVIVETARGLEFGEVVIGPRDVPESEIVAPLKTVIRKATHQDQEKVKDNQAKEKEAFAICEQKIKTHNLPMNLVDVEYTFDVNKIIFYFTAEGRIDFRELVKDLAAVFRTRIELRQIGVRDEAKMMGGIGCCGRSLCCSTFLGDFEPVSIRMAKDQNLSLNPTKISGICGRLMCCLKYESDCYTQTCKKILPPTVGRSVITVEGEGKVVSINNNKKTAVIQLEQGKNVVVPWEEVVEKEGDE